MIKMHKLALLVVAAVAISSASAAVTPVRMHLTHTDAGRGLTQRELLHRMAQRSKARAERLLSEGASAQVTPGKPDGPDNEYLVHFGIGTPAQPVQLTLDSGSDLVWTQCERPCVESVDCFKQDLAKFDASRSTTFAELTCDSAACKDLGSSLKACDAGTDNQPCQYSAKYGDNSETSGHLATDTFQFAGGAAVSTMAFGCGLKSTGIFNSGETGIAGFGRGPLSLPSQLKVDNFSHCFTGVTGSKPSPVLLGLPANLFGSDPSAVQSTPFIQETAHPTFYYVSLKGITVGSTRLSIPESAFAVTDGTGGTIIDSGTGITMVPKEVFNIMRDAFIDQVSLPVQKPSTGPDLLCFTAPPGTNMPKLILHFDGATLDLPRENYIFQHDDAGVSLTCLVIAIADKDTADMTIIGNYQQQNMHVLYDLANNMLSFVPAQCDKV